MIQGHVTRVADLGSMRNSFIQQIVPNSAGSNIYGGAIAVQGSGQSLDTLKANQAF
jgi:hypothetical protein